VSASSQGETRVVADQVQSVNAGFPRYIDVQNRPTDFPTFMTHLIQFDHRVFAPTNVNRVNVTNDLVATFLSTIASTPLGGKFSSFGYSRSPLKVRIVVQGQPFAAGKIVCSFMPNINAREDFVMTGGVGQCATVNSMIVPHVVIDPSKTETYEIELPVCTATGAWTIRNYENMGSYLVQYTFITPVLSGTATAASIACCMYVGFAEPSLEGLTLLANDFEAEKKPGVVSSFFHTVGKYSPLVSVPFPSLAPGVTLFSNVANSVGDFLNYLGFSKPPTLEVSTFPTTRNVDNWSQFEGKSNAIVLAGSQTTSLGLSSKYGGVAKMSYC